LCLYFSSLLGTLIRDYGVEPLVWDGEDGCDHIWEEKNKVWYKDRGKGKHKEVYCDLSEQKTEFAFCLKCGAWRGSLGLEPYPSLYIKHLCDIFDQVKRVLKKEGTCWVNIADTYGGSGGAGGDYNEGGLREGQPKYKGNKLPAKSLVGIPEMFVLEMQRRGWVRRNTIIWYKPNCMPSSAKDRFTVDFEYVYFFTHSKKYWFEQQFEPVQECSIARLNRAISNKHKNINGVPGQTPHSMNQPRPNRNYKRYEKSQAPHEFEGADHLVSLFDPKKGRNKRCVWRIPTNHSLKPILRHSPLN